MSSWNIADLWEVAAEIRQEHPAQIHGTRSISWTEFDRRADGLARTLLDAGVG
jgi:3-oxocholest-4-en-26-oate---CoA ligase